MFAYFDTSVVLKTYVLEPRSEEAIELLNAVDGAIPLSQFLTFEIGNALQLKVFRREIELDAAKKYSGAFLSDLEIGYFYYPPCELENVFKIARDLSNRQSSVVGARSLDILHVASAIEIGCDHFLTFDKRQAQLASDAGLKTKMS